MIFFRTTADKKGKSSDIKAWLIPRLKWLVDLPSIFRAMITHEG